MTASPLGSMNTTPRPACGVGEDLPGDQGGLAGAGRPADPQVVAGVGDGQADRAGLPGVGDAERPGVRAGQRGWRAAAGRRVPRRGPGRAAPGRRAAGRSRRARAPTAGRRGAAGGCRSAAAGWRRRRRASQFRPAYRAVAEARAWARPRSRARVLRGRRRGPASGRPRPGRARRWWRRRSGSGFPIAGWPACSVAARISAASSGSERDAARRVPCWRGRRGWPGPAAGR